MKRTGPDSLTSWVIAGACCILNMMMFGMNRLSGVLFVASVSRFNVPRDQASFPYAFASFMRNIIAPLIGYLGHRFGVRVVTTWGSIIAAIGVGGCFLAADIDAVTVLWGGVFGTGFGLGNILLPVSINQHFDKHRASANGISYSGACLGSFFLPPLVDLLLDTYGLTGTYLILCGFVLNCIPAALLLRKPHWKPVSGTKSGASEEGEKQSIVSGRNVKLYTEEHDSLPAITVNDSKTILSLKVGSPKQSPLTYDDRMERLSTQTLLSDYAIRMSTTGQMSDEEIIQNSKGRRKVDPDVLDADAFSVSSQSTEREDDVFVSDLQSYDVQCENSTDPDNAKRNRSVSCQSVKSIKNSFFKSNTKTGHQNYGYEDDTNNIQIKHDCSSQTIPVDEIQKRTFSQCGGNREVYFNSYKRNSNAFADLHGKYKSSNTAGILNSLEYLGIDNFKVRKGKLDLYQDKDLADKKIGTSVLGSFSIMIDPIFLLIAITNAIYSFTFVCMFTIIVDFARDLEIGVSNEKYVLMTLSVGDLIGRLGLGWVTDRGYMTTTGFTALLFAFQGFVIAATPLSTGFLSLICLGSLYGLSEAGIIVLFPVVMAQYIEQDKQTVAISSSNFFCGPICLAIAPMIGYFRDHLGAYDYIFYLLGISSFACCFSWILAPCIARCQRKQKSPGNTNVQNT